MEVQEYQVIDNKDIDAQKKRDLDEMDPWGSLWTYIKSKLRWSWERILR